MIKVLSKIKAFIQSLVLQQLNTIFINRVDYTRLYLHKHKKNDVTLIYLCLVLLVVALWNSKFGVLWEGRACPALDALDVYNLFCCLGIWNNHNARVSEKAIHILLCWKQDLSSSLSVGLFQGAFRGIQCMIFVKIEKPFSIQQHCR